MNASSILSSQDQLKLSSWGLPLDVAKNYEKCGISEMFPWQVECLSLPGILDGKNLVYSAPTSAGKTLVAEIVLLKNVLERKKKGIFILPFVSIAREKTFYLQKLFGVCGVKVEGFMGGHLPPGGFQKTDIAICTIEKANNIINRLIEEKKVEDLGILVVDELHMVGDSHRGYLLELLLTKLQFVSAVSKNIQIQVVGMSATLPNLHIMAKWLNAALYATTFRPVPLEQMVKIGSVLYNQNFEVICDLNISHYRVKDDADHLIQLCLETVLEGYSLLMFCPTKVWCEKIALIIASSFFSIGRENSEYSPQMVQGLRGRLNGQHLLRVIESLRNCPAGLDSVLAKSLAFGAAFHHAGLTLDERDIIEAAFRSGFVPVLVATSTLSSGVNLPARRVIIRSPNAGPRLIDALVYHQMVGRAGRKGKDIKGESILMCAANERYKAEQLLRSCLPPITSCLQTTVSVTSSMKRAILEVIVSGAAKTAEHLNLYWKSTLLSASLAPSDGDSLSKAEFSPNAVQECVQFLVENELVRSDGFEGAETFHGTQLGNAVLAAGLSPDEGLHVFSELHRARQCFVLENELHIVYQVTPMYVSDAWPQLDWVTFLNIWEELPAAMKKVGELAGVQESFIVSAIKGTLNTKILKLRRSLAIHQRFYAALALHDLVHEVPLKAVVQKYGATKGLLQALQQQAATFAGMVTVFCNRLGWNNLELLISQFQNRLHFGVQRDLCDLVRLSLLNGRRARTLFNAGFETIQDIAHSTPQTIEKIFYNSGPFKSNNGVGDNGFILGPSGSPMSIAEASEYIVTEARTLLQKELGIARIDWDQENSGEHNASSHKSRESAIHSESASPLFSQGKSNRKLSSYESANAQTKSPTTENATPVCERSAYSKRPSSSSLERQRQVKTPKILKKMANDERNIFGDSHFGTRRKGLINLNSGMNQSSISASDLEIKDLTASRPRRRSKKRVASSHENADGTYFGIKSSPAMLDQFESAASFDGSKRNSVLSPECLPSRPLIDVGSEHKKELYIANSTPCSNDSSCFLSDSIKAELLQSVSFSYPRTAKIENKRDRTPIESPDLFQLISDGEEEKENHDQIDYIARGSKPSTNYCEANLPKGKPLTSKSFTVNNNDRTPMYSACSEQLDFDLSHSLISETSEKKSVCVKSRVDSKGKNNSDLALNENKTLDSLFSSTLPRCDFGTESDEEEEDFVVMTESGALSMTREAIDKEIDAFESSIMEKSSHRTAFLDTVSDSLLDRAFEKYLSEEAENYSGKERKNSVKRKDSSSSEEFSLFLSPFTNSESFNDSVSSSSNKTRRSFVEPYPEEKDKEDSHRVKEQKLLLVSILDSSSEITPLTPREELSVNDSLGVTLKHYLRLEPDKESSSTQTSTHIRIIDVTGDDKLFKTFIDEWKTKDRFALCLACEKVPAQPKDGIGWRIGGRSRRPQLQQRRRVAGLTVSQTELLLTGLAVCWGHTNSFYINFNMSHEAPEYEEPTTKEKDEAMVGAAIRLQERVDAVRKVLTEGGVHRRLCAWQAKETMKLLCRSGLGVLKVQLGDPRVAAWLLDPCAKQKNLSAMVLSHLKSFAFLLDTVGCPLGHESMGMGKGHDSAKDSLRLRSATESVLVFHLTTVLEKRLEEAGLIGIWQSVEMPSIHSFALMELNGLGFSHSLCQEQKTLMQEKLDSLEAEAFCLAGHRFSLSSPREVAKVLYSELRLGPPSDGKPKATCRTRGPLRAGGWMGGGMPTNKEALEKLCPLHPLPKIILQWRKIHCAITRVVLPLIEEAKLCSSLREDRIFPVCHTFTATGRITFHEPNVQTIPRPFAIDPPLKHPRPQNKTKNYVNDHPVMRQLGQLLEPLEEPFDCAICLRKVIVAGSGRILLAADYSQLELRILAHMASETKLLGVLNDGGDVFNEIASEIRSLSISQVSSIMRQEAKQIVYGLIYGMGETTLADQLGVSIEEALRFLSSFERRYPAVRSFVYNTIQDARTSGYTTTLAGRKRFLPGLSSTSSADVAQCERQAVNTRIQGSAADLVKKAMIAIQDKLRENFSRPSTTLSTPLERGQKLSGAYFVLQLHDELIYEVANDDVIQVAQIVRDQMESAYTLSVRLPVKIKVGPSWGTLQALNL